ncbi:MAG TPA: hypothetical protein DCY20_02265 [Firmicutes bacterium]|nr:hypothetical protein [Bacillota bacterium]
MKIQKAKLGDLVEIINLLKVVKTDLNKKGIMQWTEGFDEIEMLRDINLGRTFIARKDGCLIATFSLKTKQLDPIQQTLRSPFLYLYKLALQPSQQRKGYGKQLIDYAATLAKDNEFELYLDCWSGNEKLKSFYRSVGFTDLGDIPEDDYYISVFKYLNR